MATTRDDVTAGIHAYTAWAYVRARVVKQEPSNLMNWIELAYS